MGNDSCVFKVCVKSNYKTCVQLYCDADFDGSIALVVSGDRWSVGELMMVGSVKLECITF